MSSELENLFENHTGRLVRKWMHYFDVYTTHFERYRDKPITILEIGVCDGGSLQLWKEYFGDSVRIIGVDLDPRCKAFEEDGIEIHIGSQDDRNFLKNLKTKIPKVDILLDDGGHTMSQQIGTFEELFDHVADDGVYFCEDVHTSYWPTYGGGYNREGTYIEYCKNLIDKLNAWHSRKDDLSVDEFTRTAGSIHFYDSIVAIEKKKVQKPKVKGRGKWNYTAVDLPKVLAIYDEEFSKAENQPVWMRVNYGKALMQAQKYSEADDQFRVCIDANPSHWSLWLLRAQAHHAIQSDEKAHEYATNALEFRDGLVPALLILAEVSKRRGDVAGCKHFVNRILENDSNHKGAMRILQSIDDVQAVG